MHVGRVTPSENVFLFGIFINYIHLKWLFTVLFFYPPQLLFTILFVLSSFLPDSIDTLLDTAMSILRIVCVFIGAYMFRAQSTSVAVKSTQYICKSGPKCLMLGTQKMRSTQLLPNCEHFGLSDFPTITQELCDKGRGRIQFSRVAFNCINHETNLSLPAVPCLIHYTSSNFFNKGSKGPETRASSITQACRSWESQIGHQIFMDTSDLKLSVS